MIHQPNSQRKSIFDQSLTILHFDWEASPKSTGLCVPGICRKGSADSMQLGQAVANYVSHTSTKWVIGSTLGLLVASSHYLLRRPQGVDYPGVV